MNYAASTGKLTLSALLLVGLVREKSFGATEGRRLKNRLMAEARRPDHVGK